MTLIHLYIVRVLIHNLKNDFILFLVLLVQCFHSNSWQPKYSRKTTFRLLMIHLFLLFLLLLFGGILVVFASMLSLNLTLHELLSGCQIASMSVLSICIFFT